MATSLDQQLSMYLQDVHAIELQALEQVKRAPKIAGDPEIAGRSRTTSGRPSAIGSTSRIAS